MTTLMEDPEVRRSCNKLNDGIALLIEFAPELDEHEREVLAHAGAMTGHLNIAVPGRYGMEDPDPSIVEPPEGFPTDRQLVPQALDEASAKIAEVLLRRGLRWDR